MRTTITTKSINNWTVNNNLLLFEKSNALAKKWQQSFWSYWRLHYVSIPSVPSCMCVCFHFSFSPRFYFAVRCLMFWMQCMCEVICGHCPHNMYFYTIHCPFYELLWHLELDCIALRYTITAQSNIDQICFWSGCFGCHVANTLLHISIVTHTHTHTQRPSSS